jgi:hypothetical protein
MLATKMGARKWMLSELEDGLKKVERRAIVLARITVMKKFFILF